MVASVWSTKFCPACRKPVKGDPRFKYCSPVCREDTKRGYMRELMRRKRLREKATRSTAKPAPSHNDTHKTMKAGLAYWEKKQAREQRVFRRLVRSAKAGDTDAAARLWNEHSLRIYTPEDIARYVQEQHGRP